MENRILGDRKFIRFQSVFDFRKNWLIILSLCLIPIILYWITLSFEIVWDDKSHFIKNPYFNPFNFNNLLHFWKEIHWGLYIPISYTFWGLIKEFSLLIGLEPDSPLVFHLANNLLHAFNGIIVFTLLRQIIQNKWFALIGALFFILHPIQVETVAWASEFRSLLSFSFGFTALYQHLKSCYFKYDVRNLKLSKRYYIYGLLLFVAAVLSKPSIIVLIFFAPILEFFIYRTSLKKLIIRFLPYLLPVIAIVLITTGAQGDKGALSYPVWMRPLIYGDNILFYLNKIFIPFNYSASYARTTAYVSEHWWFYFAWIIPLIIGIILWKNWKKLELIILGFVLFVLGFLTVSGLIKFDFQVWSNVADRYIYISMFGMAIIVSASIEKLKLNKKIIFLISGIYLIALSFLSYQNIKLWENKFTLWNNVVNLYPQEPKAWLNRGVWYVSKKEYVKAKADFRKIIDINPNFADAHANMGRIYTHEEKYEVALIYFNKAISIRPKLGHVKERAKIYRNLGQYSKALDDYYRAIKIDKNDPMLYNDAGGINLILKNYTQAISDCSKCLALAPESKITYYNRGIAYYKLKRYEQAISDFKKAIQIDPDYIQAMAALEKALKHKTE